MAELSAWNRELEQRARDQIEQLERVGRLRRFLPQQLADLIISSGDESFLNAHRRQITVVCCDLRGFTAFAETAEPEDVWEILGEYNGALGDLIGRFEGTLERFTGDGLVIFFNDPIPCDDAPMRSVWMALAMRQRVQELADGWQRRGHELALGVGIAQGYATLGRIASEPRSPSGDGALPWPYADHWRAEASTAGRNARRPPFALCAGEAPHGRNRGCTLPGDGRPRPDAVPTARRRVSAVASRWPVRAVRRA